MSLRTEIKTSFLLRMGIVGLVCLGMTGLCIKDGKYAYPAQRERALAYIEFQEENPDVGEKDLFDLWKIEAAERGWEPGIGRAGETPYGHPKTESDFIGQFYMGGVAAFIGLLFVGRVLLNRGCWIEADDEGITTSEKKHAKFDQVTVLDKKKWDNKGIAKLRYEADGKNGTIVLDDCNYDRPTTNEILRHVEAKIGFDKIINGKPEKTPKPESDEPPAQS